MDKEVQSEQQPEDLNQTFANLITSVQIRFNELEEKERWWKTMEERMKRHAESASKKITLDVGGQRFTTTKDTLLACKGSFFEAMLSSGHWKPDADGVYFIDRSPALFPIIMDFIRNGKVHLERYHYDVTESLKEELDFYQITVPEVHNKLFCESTLLKEDFYKHQIAAWINKPTITTQLLYRASRDGAKSHMFHAKCDKLSPTLIIIKSRNERLFGGYSTASWDGPAQYKRDEACFVFNLYPAVKKYPVDKERAITANPSYGPVFGTNHDIMICNDFTTTEDNYTMFGGEKQRFCCADIEVFLVS